MLYLMDYINVVFKCTHFVLGQWKGGHKLNSRVIQTERRSQLDSRGVQKERSFETQLLRVFVDPSNESIARINMKYGVFDSVIYMDSLATHDRVGDGKPPTHDH